MPLHIDIGNPGTKTINIASIEKQITSPATVQWGPICVRRHPSELYVIFEFFFIYKIPDMSSQEVL